MFLATYLNGRLKMLLDFFLNLSADQLFSICFCDIENVLKFIKKNLFRIFF